MISAPNILVILLIIAITTAIPNAKKKHSIRRSGQKAAAADSVLSDVTDSKETDAPSSLKLELNGYVVQNPPAQTYSKAAVAADAPVCAEIGSNILRRNGTAIEAAIATLFCNGLINMESCGIGGGGFMNIYIAATKKSYLYDFRETAPAAATEDMFEGKENSDEGGLAIAIPGNVKGLRHAYENQEKIGSKRVLKWKDLIQPTIDLAENGFVLTKSAGGSMKNPKIQRLFNKSEGFKQLLLKEDKTWYKTGDVIKNPQLAATLKIIQKKPDDFYTGKLAKKIVKDIKDAGGNITEEDLKNYKVVEREARISEINGLKYIFFPPPSSSSVVAMALNILKGYNYRKKDYVKMEQKINVMHTFIEALKFAYGRRPLLGDYGCSSQNEEKVSGTNAEEEKKDNIPTGVNGEFCNVTLKKMVEKVLDDMFNQTLAEELRIKIGARTLGNDSFYTPDKDLKSKPKENIVNHGTSHISILAENGDAVSATDTIDFDYGGGVRSAVTGIIYNNEMDDFSSPSVAQNAWGYKPAPANYIEPGKRPLSSMSPTIVLDENGDVVMVVGGSGGSRIITGTAVTLFRKLFLQMDLASAINENRIHTHLSPDEVYINMNYRISDKMQNGLKDRGHKMVLSELGVAIQAIYREKKGSKIYAMGDPRKGGYSSGY